MRKNRLKYLSLVALTFIFAYFYGGRVPYMMLQVVILMPVISFVHLIICMSTLKYSQVISTRAPMKGDKVEYNEVIVNESIVPCCYIEVVYFYSKYLTGFDYSNKRYWLGPQQRIEEVQHIQFAHRGIYEFGAIEIIFTDLFGLFRIPRKIDEYIRARVVPKVYDLQISDMYNDKNLEAQIRSRRHFEDVSLFEDVRQYQYGDNMKRVHWKLSAKYRELLVKNYSGISRNSVTVLIDMQASDGDPEEILSREDSIIESSISVIKSFSDKYEKIQAIFFDRGKLNSVQISNPQDFLNFYDTIGLMEFRSEYSITALLKNAILNNMSSGNVLIVSGSLDLNFLGELLEVCIKGYDTSLILCETVKEDSAQTKLIGDIKSQGVLVLESSIILKDEGVKSYG